MRPPKDPSLAPPMPLHPPPSQTHGPVGTALMPSSPQHRQMTLNQNLDRSNMPMTELETSAMPQKQVSQTPSSGMPRRANSSIDSRLNPLKSPKSLQPHVRGSRSLSHRSLFEEVGLSGLVAGQVTTPGCHLLGFNEPVTLFSLWLAVRPVRVHARAQEARAKLDFPHLLATAQLGLHAPARLSRTHNAEIRFGFVLPQTRQVLRFAQYQLLSSRNNLNKERPCLLSAKILWMRRRDSTRGAVKAAGDAGSPCGKAMTSVTAPWLQKAASWSTRSWEVHARCQASHRGCGTPKRLSAPTERAPCIVSKALDKSEEPR